MLWQKCCALWLVSILHAVSFFSFWLGGGYELQQLCLYLAVGFQGSTNNIPFPVSACLGQPFGLHLTGKQEDGKMPCVKIMCYC